MRLVSLVGSKLNGIEGSGDSILFIYACIQRLQDSQIACNKLSEEKKNLEATVKRFEDEGLVYRKQFDDVRQQLASVNEGSMIAQKDIAEALREAQDVHEQEVYKLHEELNQLKAAMSAKEKEVQSFKDVSTRSTSESGKL